MRAVITNPKTIPALTLQEAPQPRPAVNEALVRVNAFSLNAGETRTALEARSNYIPGWDFAGVVEEAAADGSSPGAGVKVFGFVTQGAWAEFVCVRSGQIVEIPSGMTIAQAAAVPVAGVTAMLCLEKAGALVGRRVLITGAAGGVGRFACQLAAISGATVFAVSRRSKLREQLRDDGLIAADALDNRSMAKLSWRSPRCLAGLTERARILAAVNRDLEHSVDSAGRGLQDPVPCNG